MYPRHQLFALDENFDTVQHDSLNSEFVDEFNCLSDDKHFAELLESAADTLSSTSEETYSNISTPFSVSTPSEDRCASPLVKESGLTPTPTISIPKHNKRKAETDLRQQVIKKPRLNEEVK